MIFKDETKKFLKSFIDISSIILAILWIVYVIYLIAN